MRNSIFFLFCMLGAMTLPVAQAQTNEAELFALSTGHEESCLTFMPDGNTAYFQKGIAWSRLSIIVFSELKNGKWTEPGVAPFSGRYRDGTPFISPDGERLFFNSVRPVDGKPAKRDLDIWFVEKTANGWGEPQNLGLPINTADHETSPSVTADGTLYFSSNRAGARGGSDIYRSKLVDGKYTEPEPLGEEISSPSFDANPCIDARGERLFFASSRPGGAGATDIYLSVNRNGRWEAARNIGSPINTPGAELWTSISPDGRYLYFYNNRKIGLQYEKGPLNYSQLVRKLRSPGNGSTDIYRIELSALKLVD